MFRVILLVGANPRGVNRAMCPKQYRGKRPAERHDIDILAPPSGKTVENDNTRL